MSLYPVILLLSAFAGAQSPSPVSVVSNAVSTTTPVYTDFDLFKNSGFGFCTINNRQKADPSSLDFIVARYVRNQTEFCSYLAGIPIMIPTTPTQTAFFPWYPTLLAQGLSLAASYFGLYCIFRYLDRSRMLPSRKRLPFYFWLVLLIDSARQIAFHFKTIHGFVNPDRFAWTNLLLWLLPLNYITLARLLHTSRRDAIYEEPWAGSTMQFAQLRSNGQIGFTPDRILPAVLNGPSSPNHPLEKRNAILRSSFPTSSNPTPFSARFPSTPDDPSPHKPHGLTTWLAILATSATWFLSFVTTILHWKWSYGPPASNLTRTYPPLATVLTDPQTVGNMPMTCLTYLQSNSLSTTSFFAQTTDQLPFALITTLQFLTSSFVLIYAYTRRHDEPFDRAYRILYASVAVTLVLLLIPAFAVGIDIATKVLQDGQVIDVRFTNDLSVTGGCTFAYVNMNKRYGYWDVEVERGFRIVMSLLGAS